MPPAASPQPVDRRPPFAPVGTGTTYGRMANENDDEQAEGDAEAQVLGEQLEAATDAIRAAVIRLLQEGEVHPQLVVMAAARVAGELGAAAALAGGQDAEAMLGELDEVVREAGREHLEALRMIELPAAGSA